MITQMTIREIRKFLFDSNKSMVFKWLDEMTNKDARRFLYDMEDQDQDFRMVENGDFIYVW